MNDKTDFWQMFGYVAQSIEDELTIEGVQNGLAKLVAYVHRFRAEHPEFFEVGIKGEGPHYDFAMLAATYLVDSLDRNLLQEVDDLLMEASEVQG